MKLFQSIFLLLCISQSFAQKKTTTYRLTEYFKSGTINQITINEDGTFKFENNTGTSCLLWKTYKGKWKKENNTVYFYEEYEISEKDMMMHYNRNTENAYTLNFSTDNKSELKQKEITIDFLYDFDSKIATLEKKYILDTNNNVRIECKDIPEHDKLASMKITYKINKNEVRYGYITENEIVNVKIASIPNLVNIEFQENIQKETVLRTTKGEIKNNTLEIISTIKSKTETQLEDNLKALIFEKKYTLLE